jgi:tetratricopeptide (TPR) repeat protein
VIANGLGGGGEPASRLAAWLLRPLIDLGPFAMGPLYAHGIESYWHAFEDPAAPVFCLQRALPRAFRVQLVNEVARSHFDVRDPRALPVDFRTQRWELMCQAMEGWNDLTSAQQCRLVLLLHGLGFYAPILTLVPEGGPPRLHTDPHREQLCYWRASAHYMIDLPNSVTDYGAADMSTFESMAAARPPDSITAFNAAVKVFVHKSKVGAPMDELTKWRARVEKALDGTSQLDPFTRQLLTSRFYRAVAFLPQRSGDSAEVVRLMDLAERHALQMTPSTSAEELLYLENLHPVMESRTKEALWLGDLDLALTRALKVIDLDPYDSKAWVELGEVRMRRAEYAPAAEAYVVAAMLGPPASAIARHMAGLCFKELGRDLMAAFFFKDAVEVDPLAISPRDEICELPEAKVLTVVKEWSRRTFHS